jgi:predicted ATPase/transcriptional regulator with XRE-family HTH domain/Tfp pilus assembly protein PilF
MAEGGEAAFGQLLRRYRGAAGLTQEELAERAGLSARGVSDLERGLNRSPQRETLRRLADALNLNEADRAVLMAARRRSTPPPSHPAVSNGVPHNLPRELSGFVGRDADIGTVRRLLDGAPLVTLAGTGGVGKTRLALRAARDLVRSAASAYPDGVWLIELADLGEARLVPQRIAATLGIGDDPNMPQLDTIEHVIRRLRILLVLDNCEHLIDVCAFVCDRLLRASDGLHILATSREPLGVSGEVVFRVPPLATPATDEAHAGIDEIARSEAVRLFVQRTGSVQPTFRLDASNADAVAHICRRVDGIPLAIELAAARLVALSPRELASRLDDGFRLLVSDKRTTPPRQQTLERTIEWSYAQLTFAEQDVFDRLAAFASVTPDAADAVLGERAFDHIVRLVSVSLVQAERCADASTRFRMLTPLREFGRQRLEQRGLLHAAQQCHAEHFVRQVEGPGPLAVTSQQEMVQLVNSELDNLRIAHDWLVATRQTELALRLSAALELAWNRPDLRSEGCARLEDVLALPDAERFAVPYARVVCALGIVSLTRSDMQHASEYLERGLQLVRASQDPAFESLAYAALGLLAIYRGDLDRAEASIERALAIARQLHNTFLEARSLNGLVDLALSRGDLAAAEEHALAGVRLGDQTADVFSQAMAVNYLGDVYRSRGDLVRADASYARALSLFMQLGGQGRPYHGLLHNMGYVMLGRKSGSAAAALFFEAAEGYERGGTDRRGIAECVLGLAAVAVSAGKPLLAGRLIGAADASLEMLGTTVSPSNRADYYRTRLAAEAALEAREWTSALELGRQLTLENALDAARCLADA